MPTLTFSDRKERDVQSRGGVGLNGDMCGNVWWPGYRFGRSNESEFFPVWGSRTNLPLIPSPLLVAIREKRRKEDL